MDFQSILLLKNFHPQSPGYHHSSHPPASINRRRRRRWIIKVTVAASSSLRPVTTAACTFSTTFASVLHFRCLGGHSAVSPDPPVDCHPPRWR